MPKNQIIELQKRVGATPDGFWGPASIEACKAHLRSLMPNDPPWPTTDQASLTKFYGRAGDEPMLVPLAVGDLDIRYDGKNVESVLKATLNASQPTNTSCPLDHGTP